MGPGQPPLFKTPEDLQSKIDEYFENCKGKIIPPEEAGEEPTVIYGEPVTITGLALYLGFESRQSLYDYEKRSEYSYIIKRSRLIVECEYEKKLQSKNPTGNIFALKNMGWADRSEIDQRTTLEDNRIDPSKLTDDELRTLAEIQRKSGVSKA